MNKNLTSVLSGIYVAEKKKKKLIVFSILNCNFDLLNFLWKGGFIYGYAVTEEGTVNIFLKYSHSGNGFFSNIVFLKKQKVSLRELKSLSVLHKNYCYLVLTSKGILSIGHCLERNMSGYLIVRF